MSESKWIICPVCGSKTRTKIRIDTILKKFPLFCPKCKRETVISAKQLNVSVGEEVSTKDNNNNSYQ